jgi:hypothetical protein
LDQSERITILAIHILESEGESERESERESAREKQRERERNNNWFREKEIE